MRFSTNWEEVAYLHLLHDVAYGQPTRNPTPDRTGTGTFRSFGEVLKFDLTDKKLPVITTKRVWLRAVIHELVWFISGSRHTLYLKEHGVEKIWEPWADEGHVGNLYGAQWRSWRHPLTDEENGGAKGCTLTEIDQLRNLERGIRRYPHSRRHIMTTWHVGDVVHKNLALPPCHGLVFQVCVDSDGDLHAMMYQRSADLFIGVPFNITSYALLTHLLAHTTGYNAASLTMFFGDAHVYSNHLEAIDEQLKREPFPFPTVSFDKPPESVCDFNASHFKINGYQSHPPINAEVAI